MKSDSDFLKLTFVTDHRHFSSPNYLRLISECIASGVTAVQLREKPFSYHPALRFGQQLQTLLQSYHIPLIINDQVELCLKLNATGVHLGQRDENIQKARKQLGPHKIIGLTVETEEQLQKANNLPLGCINYVGIGAVFPSASKTDAPVIGLHKLKKLVSLSNYPVVAIGGITEKNIESVLKTNASGIAAIDAFHRTSNPQKMTQSLRVAIDKHHRESNEHQYT